MSSNIDHPVESVGPALPAASPRRSPSKDHLQSQAGTLSLVGQQATDLRQTDRLVYWTLHPTKPHLVDLREFAEGKLEHGDASYSPRRALIEQFVPAIQARHSLAAPRTIDTIKAGLRKWWRLFDSIEAEENRTNPQNALAKRLTSVLDLGALHGSRAVQSGMSPNDFHSFVVLADLTRLALGMKRPLHWQPPAKRKRKLVEVLPPEDIKAIYHGMKADWHNAVDRWSLTQQLISGVMSVGSAAGQFPLATPRYGVAKQVDAADQPLRPEPSNSELVPSSEEQVALVAGLRLWQATVDRLGHVDLLRQDLVESAGDQSLPVKAFNISEVAKAIYPNGIDIRSAFHLCLAVGGLNPSVLLELRLDLPEGLQIPDDLSSPATCDSQKRLWVLQYCPFLVQSPIDDEYYIEGWKNRSKSWVSRTYKWKQHLTPGPVLVELIIRTWPLRVALNRRLEAARASMKKAIDEGATDDQANGLQQQVLDLTDAVRSVWLYRGMHFITWLTETDYSLVQPRQTYLQWVTCRLNEERRAQQKPEIASMLARRFRDSYAAWALGYSGGDVLAVMVALDHKRLGTTDGYLENTVVRTRIIKKYRLFAQALFGSLASGKLDATLLALETRYAEKAPEERTRMALRLVEYREAVKSRYGVGCRDPYHPSKLADPTFDADGVNICTAHRCTLCHDNAIITPDAYPGLMLRLAELEIQEEGMPVASFVMSSLDAELQNVRTALLPMKEINPGLLAATVASFKHEIRTGGLRVPGFSVKPL
jgi:hypothetical protein